MFGFYIKSDITGNRSDLCGRWVNRPSVSYTHLDVYKRQGTGRTLHPDNMAAGPASYGMTDTLGRMHSDAQFAGSSSVPAHVEMMGLILSLIHI